MATQAMPTPDKFTLREEDLDNLRQQANEQGVDLSTALARAIMVSGAVMRNMRDPQSKVLFKHGKKYTELVTSWRS